MKIIEENETTVQPVNEELHSVEGPKKTATEERFSSENNAEPAEKHENGPDQSRWGKNSLWTDLLAIVGVLVGSQILFGVLSVFFKTSEMDNGFGIFAVYVLAFTVTIVFALALLKHHGGEKQKLKFSIRKTNPSVVLWGVVLLLAMTTVVEPLVNLFPEVYLDSLEGIIGSGMWAMLTTVVCAPILEEILFRGIIQENITKRYGGIVGVLAASAIFAIIHLVPQQVVNAFFVGIILGYIYIRTKSLTPVILIHAINNGLALLLMKIFGRTSVTLNDLIGNNTLYWVFYGCCVALLLVSSYFVYKHLREETGERKFGGKAV